MELSLVLVSCSGVLFEKLVPAPEKLRRWSMDYHADNATSTNSDARWKLRAPSRESRPVEPVAFRSMLVYSSAEPLNVA